MCAYKEDSAHIPPCPTLELIPNNFGGDVMCFNMLNPHSACVSYSSADNITYCLHTDSVLFKPVFSGECTVR